MRDAVPLWLHSMPARLVLVYLAVGTAWIYGVVDRRGGVGSLVVLVALYCFQIGIGIVAGRWWALALPLLWLPLSLPAGAMPSDGDLDRTWEIVLLITLPWIALIALGVVLRKLVPVAIARWPQRSR